MTPSRSVQTGLDANAENNFVFEEARIDPASGLIAPVVTASAVSGTQGHVSWAPVPGAARYALLHAHGDVVAIAHPDSFPARNP